jgi:hypothetical protein
LLLLSFSCLLVLSLDQNQMEANTHSRECRTLPGGGPEQGREEGQRVRVTARSGKWGESGE